MSSSQTPLRHAALARAVSMVENQRDGFDALLAVLHPRIGRGRRIGITGPPGAGKSLLASCMPGILPELSPAEALEVSMIASVAGSLDGGRLLRTRPFRAPHHSASMPALVGGGLRIRPGEVSLAHLGVLFLDELPEFAREALETLREPLEAGTVTVHRTRHRTTMPARFHHLAAVDAHVGRLLAYALPDAAATPAQQQLIARAQQAPVELEYLEDQLRQACAFGGVIRIG